MHVGFVLRAVRPAGPVALPAPFEFTSPYAGEDSGSQSHPGVAGYITGHRFNKRSRSQIRPLTTS